MNRLNQILAAALVVQVVLAALVLWPWSATANAPAGPLLGDVKAADVVKLTITDNEGKALTLAKNGDAWVLPDAGDFPADSTKITPLLDKIAGIKNNRLVTQTEASHKRLQVAADDFSRRVDIQLKDGASHKLYVGSPAGASASHVRADDRPEVYLAGDLVSWDVSPTAAAWVNTMYFTTPQTSTVALILQNANGTFEFERQGDQWTMKGLAEGETFSQNNFTTVYGQATGVNLSEPEGKEAKPEFGLDKPQATVTLTTDDGKTHTLQIGAKIEGDNTYYAKSSDSPYYVRVAEFVGKTFTEKTRDNFLELPPTPEATPGAEATPVQ